MVYALFLSILISGEIKETQLKSFDRFEECWEVAQILVRNRPNMTARCVLVEK
jgi:hypothetical protein